MLFDSFASVLVASPADDDKPAALIEEDISPDDFVELSSSLTVVWLVSVEDIVLANE